MCASGVLAVLAAPACGGDSSDSSPSMAGSAGSGAGSNAGSSGKGSGAAGSAGLPTQPNTVPCGSKSCTDVTVPIQSFVIPACCADATTSHCGLDSSVLSAFGPTFSDACQPLAQPGIKDATCPDSAKTPVQGTGFEIQFPGCCREDHTCGYLLDTIGGAVRIGLGCVDATPFLDGGTPQTCGEGAAGGSAGAGGDSATPAGAGGDSATSAGAGGDSGSAGSGG